MSTPLRMGSHRRERVQGAGFRVQKPEARIKMREDLLGPRLSDETLPSHFSIVQARLKSLARRTRESASFFDFGALRVLRASAFVVFVVNFLYR
jgi:hypothetical protein